MNKKIKIAIGATALIAPILSSAIYVASTTTFKQPQSSKTEKNVVVTLDAEENLKTIDLNTDLEVELTEAKPTQVLEALKIDYNQNDEIKWSEDFSDNQNPDLKIYTISIEDTVVESNEDEVNTFSIYDPRNMRRVDYVRIFAIPSSNGQWTRMVGTLYTTISTDNKPYTYGTTLSGVSKYTPANGINSQLAYNANWRLEHMIKIEYMAFNYFYNSWWIARIEVSFKPSWATSGIDIFTRK